MSIILKTFLAAVFFFVLAAIAEHDQHRSLSGFGIVTFSVSVLLFVFTLAGGLALFIQIVLGGG